MLPRSAVAVAAWAFSPRLRHTFGGHTEWIPLEPVTTATISPKDPIIDETILRHGHLDRNTALVKRSKNIYNDAYAGLMSTFEKETCIRHAECAIMMYAAETMRVARETGAEPVRFCNYIAVNKLSCPCCWAFIGAWNKQHGTDWTTSGCHHKPYKWSVWAPELDRPSDGYLRCVRAVWDKMTDYFTAACELRFKRLHTPSNPRSDSSGEGQQQEKASSDVDDADLEEITKNLAEIEAIEKGAEGEGADGEDGGS